jgi:DNA polymerase IV (DinB-like DNA polymerase)
MSNFFTSEFNLDSYEKEVEERTERFMLHMDIDYFYAQVEILKDPDLKSLPLIVGNPSAKETGRGVVLTCSYEARKFGIRSGMAMNEALNRCPDVTIVKSNHSEYREISQAIMLILQDYKLPMRKAGSDEAYLDITSKIKKDGDVYSQAEQFAQRIKKDILNAVNLTVSIGIGPTTKIAKIASDFNKPDGIKIVLHDKLEEFFTGLPLIKIPGIGSKTSKRLEERGYTNCDQLLNRSKRELIEILGSWGDYLFRVLRGETTNRILPRGERKSISHERTFIGKPGDLVTYQEIIEKLFELTYTGLVKEEFMTKTVDLKIRFNDFETFSRSKSIPNSTQSKSTLFNIVQEIVTPYLEDARGLRLLGVGFSNLEKIDMSQTHLDDWFEGSVEKITSETFGSESKIQSLESLDKWFEN